MHSVRNLSRTVARSVAVAATGLAAWACFLLLATSRRRPGLPDSGE